MATPTDVVSVGLDDFLGFVGVDDEGELVDMLLRVPGKLYGLWRKFDSGMAQFRSEGYNVRISGDLQSLGCNS